MLFRHRLGLGLGQGAINAIHYLGFGLNLANLLVAQNQALPALVLTLQLSERLPDDGAIAFNLANLLASLGPLDQALTQFKRARRLLPGNPAPRVNLGIVRKRKRALFWARALRRRPRAR